ncbi:hypothetical protein CVV38_02285 [Candidatus Peregrinibacteria bacterium HGW-Peregrinibacteria-1]|jgi:hypothetical protein|nr:MAG: hypothetical protein CVV38_02285 [Candidatus Peregrinibacteria bacterium HGW-Peregrinibacteria-1]
MKISMLLRKVLASSSLVAIASLAFVANSAMAATPTQSPPGSMVGPVFSGVTIDGVSNDVQISPNGIVTTLTNLGLNLGGASTRNVVVGSSAKGTVSGLIVGGVSQLLNDVAIGTSGAGNDANLTVFGNISTSNGRFRAGGPGGAGAPSYSWTGYSNSGMDIEGGGSPFLTFLLNGVDRLRIHNDGTLYPNGVVRSSGGAAGAPAYSFNDDTDTGVYSAGINTLSFSTGSGERFRITSGGIMQSISNGSAAAPSYGFANDSSTGMYLADSVSSVLGFTAGGRDVMRLSYGGGIHLPALPTYGSTARYIEVGDSPTWYSGSPLNINAGSSGYGFNMSGGDLSLSSGHSTGNQGSQVRLFVTEPGASGYTTNLSTEALRITQNARVHALATAGSPTMPTYSFQDDSNTGMYQYTTDQLAFTTGGTIAMLLNSANEWKGNPSLSGISDIIKISSARGIEVGNGSGSTDVAIRMRNTVSTNNDHWMYNRTTAGGLTTASNSLVFQSGSGISSNVVFATGGTDRMVVTNTGRVGIGRNPLSNLLEVNGTASKSSSGDWLANSDARLKKNISELNSEDVLGKLLEMKGVSYEWDDDKTGTDRPEGVQYGFTAQDIAKVWPEHVEEDGNGYLQTAYGTYDFMYVESIKALYEKFQSQQSELESLKAENEALKDMMMEMKKDVEELKKAVK